MTTKHKFFVMISATRVLMVQYLIKLKNNVLCLIAQKKCSIILMKENVRIASKIVKDVLIVRLVKGVIGDLYLTYLVNV